MKCDRCDTECSDLKSMQTFNFCKDRDACDARRNAAHASLRPHSIHGWWQVWVGTVCVALLTPEQVRYLK